MNPKIQSEAQSLPYFKVTLRHRRVAKEIKAQLNGMAGDRKAHQARLHLLRSLTFHYQGEELLDLHKIFLAAFSLLRPTKKR